MTKSRPSKEFQNFAKFTDRLLAVPRDVVQKRIEQHRRKVAATPNKLKPGPNRQVR
jgi:hypothetical protein